ncbi:MAG: hypothetical protein ACTHPS_24385 [Streptosporangiaceae bacterium]
MVNGRFIRTWKRSPSRLGRGFEFGEGLRGLGEGAGEGLVPVHVRAAGAKLPRALFPSARAAIEWIISEVLCSGPAA